MTSEISAILLLIGLFFISGCGNQNIISDGQSPINLEESVKKQVVIWHTYSDVETQVFENVVVPLFEREHPDIDIKSVRQSYNEQLKSALISRASANKPPDIIRMDIAWLPLFAELDLLYPMGTFKDFGLVTKKLYDKPLKSNLYNGVYYGIPLNTNTKVAIYNRELLEKAGYNAPPETMEELINLIEYGGYEIGPSGVTTWELLPYFYGLGGKLTDPAYQHVKGYLDSKESIDAVRKMLELHRKGLLTKRLLKGSTESWEGIQDGNYFMIDEGQWFYSVQTDKGLARIREQTVAAPFPVINGKGSVLGGENLVITKGTQQAEAAWIFVKWMIGKEPQNLMLETGLIPTNKYVEVGGVFDQYPYYELYVKGIEQSFLRPPIAQWNQFDELFTKYMNLIFSESMSVENALKEAADQMEYLLQQEKGR